MDNIVNLFVNRVIVGKCEFNEVPNKIKEKVKTTLIDAGREDLIEEE